MINIKKSGLIVLLMALVIGSFAWNPPKMQCIKLLNNNQRVKVSWSCNDCAHFKAYYFYVNGVLADSLFGYSSSTQNYTLCDYGSKEINIPAPANYFDCYMTAVDSNDNQYFSDTIHSINLTVTPQSDNTMAYLEWESPTTTLNSSWGSTFDIYKKRAFEDDFPITPFASVPNTQLNYTDTSDVCDNIIYYQVSISNFYSNN